MESSLSSMRKHRPSFLLRKTRFLKNISNIEEIKARRGPVIAIGSEGDKTLESLCDATILLPAAPAFLSPFLNTVALQLLAYHTAVILGCDVDKPRNLAKCVTVE